MLGGVKGVQYGGYTSSWRQTEKRRRPRLPAEEEVGARTWKREGPLVEP